jgi:hypothetical protein
MKQLEQIHIVLRQYVAEAKRHVNNCYYADINKEDGAKSYNDFANDLKMVLPLINSTIGELNELEAHHCEYDENDYCIHCGRDGRA